MTESLKFQMFPNHSETLPNAFPQLVQTSNHSLIIQNPFKNIHALSFIPALREIVNVCARTQQSTNLSNWGLISADRSNKATLLLTIPSFIQVVYKGFWAFDISNYNE